MPVICNVLSAVLFLVLFALVVCAAVVKSGQLVSEPLSCVPRVVLLKRWLVCVRIEEVTEGGEVVTDRFHSQKDDHRSNLQTVSKPNILLLVKYTNLLTNHNKEQSECSLIYRLFCFFDLYRCALEPTEMRRGGRQ